MKKFLLRGLIFGVLVLVAAIGCTDSVSITTEPDIELSEATPIQGKYIVVLKKLGKEKLLPGAVLDIESIRNDVVSRNDITSESIITNFDYALPGFVATLDNEQLERLRLDQNIDYIEQDRIVTFAPPCDGDGGG